MHRFEDKKAVFRTCLLYTSQLNVNGLTWFVDNVFPLILRDYPDCRLKVGGSLCKAIQNSFSHPNIDLIGFVDNAADLYELGDIAINPVYQGTGLKIKTFESIAYNKITMVHPHSMNGIFDKGNAPLFASDKPFELSLIHIYGGGDLATYLFFPYAIIFYGIRFFDV